jgi:hypothetical protein
MPSDQDYFLARDDAPIDPNNLLTLSEPLAIPGHSVDGRHFGFSELLRSFILSNQARFPPHFSLRQRPHSRQ